MNGKEALLLFLYQVEYKGLLTSFLNDILDYKELNDDNYVYMVKDSDNEIIVNIYDNIDGNRFRSYIFSFNDSNESKKVINNDMSTIIKIYINNITSSKSKLMKFAYLFKSSDNINYALSFMDRRLVKIIMDIKNKSNY